MNNLRRRFSSIANDAGTDPSQAAPLEVAFYNSALNSIVIRKQEDWRNGETPIGIVVVPGYHDRYGDGTCGIMSLVGMDYNNPESGEEVTGDSSQIDSIEIHWGYKGTNVGRNIFSSRTDFKGTTSGYGYIPYQKSSNSTATDIYADNGDWVQWPYAGTSTAPTSAKSETSDVTVPSMTATTGHAVGDFNGIKNTAACYVATKSSSQWTASTVPNNYTTSNTPAAACAGRFKTIGTKSFYDVYNGITSGSTKYGTSDDSHDYKGMWYLPAEGELCYLPSRSFEISKTILALNNKYGNVGIQLKTEAGTRAYWASSECSKDYAWYVNAGYGGIYRNYKLGTQCVRAFLRL